MNWTLLQPRNLAMIAIMVIPTVWLFNYFNAALAATREDA